MRSKLRLSGSSGQAPPNTRLSACDGAEIPLAHAAPLHVAECGGRVSPSTGTASQPRRSRHIRWFVAIAFLSLLGACVWWFFHAPAPITYETATALRRDLETALTASGRIEPRADVDVGAQVSGRLEALHVDVGDRVEVGQLLAVIDAEVQAARIEALEASLAGLQADRVVLEAELGFVERQVARHTSLRGHASALVVLEESERDRDMLRGRIASLDATIRRSAAELRAEQAVLDHARITAPMAGTVTAIEARVGQTLNANYDTPVILRIADLSAMTVRSEVSEADIVHLTLGMPVRFTTLGRPDQPIEASLRRILPAPPVTEGESTSNSVVSYIALFDVDNASGALMPGMTAQVFFVTERAENALAVPLAALDDDGALRVLRPDGTAETRHPGTGMRTRAHVEILSGVAEGEQVITGTRPAGPPSPLRIVP